jgi:hypothetical protein
LHKIQYNPEKPATDQILNNSSIDVKEVIAGHAGLAGNTSRDDDNLIRIARPEWTPNSFGGWITNLSTHLGTLQSSSQLCLSSVTSDLDRSVAMRNVRSNTSDAHNVLSDGKKSLIQNTHEFLRCAPSTYVKSQISDKLVHLEEQGKGLGGASSDKISRSQRSFHVYSL